VRRRLALLAPSLSKGSIVARSRGRPTNNSPPGPRSDIKRARALLQSLTKTNPKHAPGWVAAAWLENVAGKQVAARKIIAEGCEHCPKNEDVWLCASELNVRRMRLPFRPV